MRTLYPSCMFLYLKSYTHYSLSVILICDFSLIIRRRTGPRIDHTEEWTLYGTRNVFRKARGTVIAEFFSEFDTVSLASVERGVLEPESLDTAEMDRPRNRTIDRLLSL